MTEHVALFVFGSVILAAAAWCLVLGSAGLARRVGVSEFAVGFVAIGVGPSLGVLAFGLCAGLQQYPRLAVSGLIGANIANIGLALGLAALVRPFTAKARVLSPAILVLLVATLLFWFQCRDHELARPEAGVLLLGFAAAAVYLFREARQETAGGRSDLGLGVPLWAVVVFVLAGAAGLVGGAEMVLAGCRELVRVFPHGGQGLGPTAVGLGLALPVLVTAGVAAWRSNGDLALGVVVGASLSNLLLAPGVAGLAAPLRVSDRTTVADLPALALITALLLTPLGNGLQVRRWEGVVLLVAYAGFVAWTLGR